MPLAVLPTAKGIFIWIVISKAVFYHSLTHKPLDSENNRSHITVINLLSKDLLKVRKPA